MVALSFLNRLTRRTEWWQAKISPLLAIAYASLYLHQVPAGTGLAFLAGLLFSMTCLAAFGYLVNDSFDIEADRRAGKPHAIAALAPWQRLGLCALSAVLGAIPWLFARPGATGLILLGLIYILQPVYAIPPLRLKERGFWGILTDAVYALAVPAAFVATISAQVAATPNPLAPVFILSVSMWALCFGLREMVMHQLRDEASDRACGTRTFVTARGADYTRQLVRRVIFPVEWLVLGVLAGITYTFAPAVIVFFAASSAVLLVARRVGTWKASFDDPTAYQPGVYVPLLAFYKLWPALAFALALAVRDPWYWIVFGGHLVLFYVETRRQAVDYVRIVGWMCDILARPAYVRLRPFLGPLREWLRHIS